MLSVALLVAAAHAGSWRADGARAIEQVEEELGVELPEGLVTRRASRAAMRRAVLRNQPWLQDDPEGWAGADRLAASSAAVYSAADDQILVHPANMRLMGDADAAHMVLVHEAAHAAAEALYGASAVWTSRADGLERAAFGALSEGFAQHVARRVAERHGLQRAFATVEAALIGPDVGSDPRPRLGPIDTPVSAAKPRNGARPWAGTERPTGAKRRAERENRAENQDPRLRSWAGQLRSAYVDGEAFVSAVVAAEGEAGLRRVFAEPPPSMVWIRNPAWTVGSAAPGADPLRGLRAVLRDRAVMFATPLPSEVLAGMDEVHSDADLRALEASVVQAYAATVAAPSGGLQAVALELAPGQSAAWLDARHAWSRDAQPLEADVRVLEELHAPVQSDAIVGFTVYRRLGLGPLEVDLHGAYVSSGPVVAELVCTGPACAGVLDAALAVLAAARVPEAR